MLSFTALPALGVIAANHYIVNPRKRRRVTGRISELRKEHAEFIAEKRQEAEEAVALLREFVRRRIDAERASNGTPGRCSPLRETDRTLISIYPPCRLHCGASTLR